MDFNNLGLILKLNLLTPLCAAKLKGGIVIKLVIGKKVAATSSLYREEIAATFGSLLLA